MELIPLASLFRRALESASQAQNLPTSDDKTQDLIQASLVDLQTVESRVIGLSLFSPNESLEDISTRDLVYLLVPWVHSEVLGRVRKIERGDRIAILLSIQRHIQSYLASLHTYDIIPLSVQELHTRQASSVSDPAKRRELKIKQYRQEKEIRGQIEILKNRHLPAELSTEFDLITALLPFSHTPSRTEDEDDHSDTESLVRDTTILLLQLTYVQAHAQLESIENELKLLSSMPPEMISLSETEAVSDVRGKGKVEESDWKLDAPQPSFQGPLLDSRGKPLRPFTILHTKSGERARLLSGVFAADHNLPTMTIDEYLEIEKARGGIISGGGPQKGPTASDQSKIDSEQDGTLFGEQKSEEKRLKDEGWAQFTDENQKGAGNTMNRG